MLSVRMRLVPSSYVQRVHLYDYSAHPRSVSADVPALLCWHFAYLECSGVHQRCQAIALPSIYAGSTLSRREPPWLGEQDCHDVCMVALCSNCHCKVVRIVQVASVIFALPCKHQQALSELHSAHALEGAVSLQSC